MVKYVLFKKIEKQKMSRENKKDIIQIVGIYRNYFEEVIISLRFKG